MTTATKLTDHQINNLRFAARMSGDMALMRVCDMAQAGNVAARQVCAKFISKRNGQ